MCILTLYKSYLPCPTPQFPRPEQSNYDCSQNTFTKCLSHSWAFPVAVYGAGRGGQPHPRQRGSPRGWRGAATRGAGRGSRGAPRPRWPAIVLPPQRLSQRHWQRKESEKGARGSACGRLSPPGAIGLQRREGLGPGAGRRSPRHIPRTPDPDPRPPALTSPGAPQLPATERSPVLCPARLPGRTASSSPPAAAKAALLPPRPRPRPPAPAWPAAPREASKGEGGGLTGTRPRHAPPTAPALSGCTRTQLRTTWDELMES